MKRILSVITALILLLSLCSCEFTIASPEPTMPEATLEPDPVGLDLWVRRAEARFNMEYEDFADYWSMMCDGFYGESVYVLLSVTDLAENEAEVAAKRVEYDNKYGADWHYDIADYSSEPLSERTCESFNKELIDLADKADILVNEVRDWTEAEWTDFADYHGCDVDTAQKLVAECAKMSSTLRSAEVTEAYELTLNIEFTSSKSGTLKTQETDTVYLVSGEYVFEMLLDYSTALLNLL